MREESRTGAAPAGRGEAPAHQQRRAHRRVPDVGLVVGDERVGRPLARRAVRNALANVVRHVDVLRRALLDAQAVQLHVPRGRRDGVAVVDQVQAEAWVGGVRLGGHLAHAAGRAGVVGAVQQHIGVAQRGGGELDEEHDATGQEEEDAAATVGALAVLGLLHAGALRDERRLIGLARAAAKAVSEAVEAPHLRQIPAGNSDAGEQRGVGLAAQVLRRGGAG